MEMTKNMMVAFMKDKGVSPYLVGRIENLMDSFGDVEQFLRATRPQLEATYNKSHPAKPGSRPYGLGKETFEVFDMLVAHRKGESLKERRAEETAQANERTVLDEARRRVETELLSKEIELDALVSAAAAIQGLSGKSAKLSEILQFYDIAMRNRK